ncbi:CHASE3 domain-containing protein [Desulfogranum marinum]|uniref:CHASE3 domain-containing protein n=1 Tax=Desulfogranum marinum TaxID=453220 RepID=UPI0019660DDC|nr:CHASE3 domain-containing protein [Desulfogranum marinum]MBM9514899.1 CHASE3 domain-containing protein [Desulfogranum marinum]
MRLDKLTLKVKIILGGLIPLILLAIVGIVTIVNINALVKSNEWVEHTHQVLGKARSVIMSAVDMETGMRGYLLAGKDSFLAPYTEGERQTYEKISTLQGTVSDNPKQVERLGEIDKVLKEWQKDVTEPTIALRRQIGDAKTMNDMASLVGKARGKQYFDKFRSQMLTFIDREMALLDKRKGEARSITLDSLDNINRFKQLNGWVEHTYELILKAGDIVAYAVDMETGMRGYLLAGREEFLEPYKNGEKNFYEHVAKMKETVSDNPAQVQLLGEVQETIKAWQVNVTEPTIQLRRDIGDSRTMDDMADLVAEARGKVYFDKFRQLIADFTGEEKGLMATRKADNEKRVKNTFVIVIGLTIVAIILGLLTSAYITRSAMQQLGSDPADIEHIAGLIASGDLSMKFNEDTSKNVGVYASMKSMTENLRSMFSDISKGVATLSSSSTELSAVSEQLTNNAEATTSRATTVASGAEELSTNMNSVSAAMEQSSSNVGMVATATEEMSSTVNEIAQNAARAKDISEHAVAQSQQTSTKINEMGEAAGKIGKVTETITEISEQTNLLALNATIEAARAGEAGKGFAVVANEIKELAKQTSEATVDIKKQIDEMQTTTGGTIEDINAIASVITEINEVITTIASAVEQQSAATTEISENVSQASAGIAEVNENVAQSSVAVGDITKEISDISNSSAEVSEGSGNVKESAGELSRLAEQLDELVKRFKLE